MHSKICIEFYVTVLMLPRDFADVDIDTTLRHKANSTLWVWRLIHVEVMNVWSSIIYLKIPYHAVSLSDK